MYFCPCCERTRDNHEFPKFMGGMRGKVCKSCLHYLDKFPIEHPKQKKFNNAGFQKETQAQTENRRKMMVLDAQYNG